MPRRTHRITKKRGGLLKMQPETDLINTHLCDTSKTKDKESAGQELFAYVGDVFQLNAQTVGYLQNQFKKTENKWFKFVIFNNDDRAYIYIIRGAKINKHSICMLLGLLDVTLEKGEYPELRTAVDDLSRFRLSHSVMDIFGIPSVKTKLDEYIRRVDEEIQKNIPCMPVVAAGSGTVNDDGTICINNKSGHYKPTKQSMELAKRVFIDNTGISATAVYVAEKTDKAILKSLYGEDYEDYTGICV